MVQWDKLNRLLGLPARAILAGAVIYAAFSLLTDFSAEKIQILASVGGIAYFGGVIMHGE